MTIRQPARPVLMRVGEGETLTCDWGQITWIASGALGNARGMTFGKVIIKAGCRNIGHWHPSSEEILHLLAGRLEHVVDNEVFSMQAGDTLVIPRGARHWATAVVDEDAVMLVFYPTPERKMETEGASQ